MKTFELHRTDDESGVSGTGIVAQGAIFDDGTVALRWLTTHRSSTFYAKMADVEKIHGHGGKTKIIYTGDAFGRGYERAVEDHHEREPFSSVGGSDARPLLEPPRWITPRERFDFIRGYKAGAQDLYGNEWETCTFMGRIR